jgi:hypothetical protein
MGSAAALVGFVTTRGISNCHIRASVDEIFSLGFCVDLRNSKDPPWHGILSDSAEKMAMAAAEGRACPLVSRRLLFFVCLLFCFLCLFFEPTIAACSMHHAWRLGEQNGAVLYLPEICRAH